MNAQVGRGSFAVYAAQDDSGMTVRRIGIPKTEPQQRPAERLLI